MARGFVYLAAVVDWFSRKVLAWKLSITLETEFCLEAVEEALSRHGKPDIFNTESKNIGAYSPSAARSLSLSSWSKMAGTARCSRLPDSTPIDWVPCLSLDLSEGWSIKRRGSASPMLVTQEGPDILSPSEPPRTFIPSAAASRLVPRHWRTRRLRLQARSGWPSDCVASPFARPRYVPRAPLWRLEHRLSPPTSLAPISKDVGLPESALL